MPTRIRLQRKGKKGRPYYHIVVADKRSPRDGKFIEQIGAYDPNHNPAFIEVNMDKAMDWLQKGAQPSDTCRAILSYKGLLYKNHLAGGVKKGAFTQEEADRRFDIWSNEKNVKVDAKRTKVATAAEGETKARLAEETKKAAKMAAALSAKLAAAVPVFTPVVEAEAPAETPAEAEAAPVAEAPAAEAPAETPAESLKHLLLRRHRRRSACGRVRSKHIEQARVPKGTRAFF
ncbi:MAG: 30S ribosomal protein S16 [Flavobacteriales bacterium]|nr:30S ribosomal protein S16 [Flavobacteriales bacterium]